MESELKGQIIAMDKKLQEMHSRMAELEGELSRWKDKYVKDTGERDEVIGKPLLSLPDLTDLNRGAECKVESAWCRV